MRTEERGAKRFLALLALVLAMVLSALVSARPARANEGDPMGWEMSPGNSMKKTLTLQVEAGQKFYISDFLFELQCGVYHTPVSEFGSYRKVAYSVKDKKYAAVDKNGCVTAKKAGTTTVTVKVDGKNKYTCTLKVVAKGKLGSTTTYKKMNALASTITAAYSKEITSKNFYTLAKAVVEYETLAAKYTKKINADRGYLLKTTKLAVPRAPRIAKVKNKLQEYAGNTVLDRMSLSDISKVSASGGSSRFTLTLKKKLTTEQFYLLAFAYLGNGRGSVVWGSNPSVTVKGESMYGSRITYETDEFGDEQENISSDNGYVSFTLKPGTAKVTVKYFSNSKCSKAKKLKSGYTYEFEVYDDGEEEYTFTAK